MRFGMVHYVRLSHTRVISGVRTRAMFEYVTLRAVFGDVFYALPGITGISAEIVV